MTRGRSRSSVSSARSRDTSALSLFGLPMPIARSSPWSSFLSAVQDNREFTFDDSRTAVTLGGRVARVVVHKRPIIARSNTLWSSRGLPVGVQVPVGVRFESPFKVITCIRRKVRRQIIFATGRSGKGVKKRNPRRGRDSGTVC